MPKIPAQSEPVDAKELYRRLEEVLRQREARKRKVPPTLKVESVPVDEVLESAKLEESQTPPPPTAFPTRPISEVRDFDQSRPRSVLLPRDLISKRLSANVTSLQVPHAFNDDASNQTTVFHLQELGQVTRIGAKTTSRPSTSWYVERQGRPKLHDDEDIGLAISTRPQRPKSLSHITGSEALPVVVTEGPSIRKHDSMRRGQVKSQIVQFVDKEHSIPLIAPVNAHEASYHASPNLAPLSMSFDGAAKLSSGLSSATTAFNHSASHSASSKSDRKSWNPKTLLSKLKDRNSSSEKVIIPEMEQTPSVPPLHEFTLDPIPPLHDTSLISISNRSNSPTDTPQRRQHTTIFEPFVFSEHRFSGMSDISSARLSDPHSHFRHSDLDSGLGMSDTNSNFAMSNMSNESIPTLMPGAEKRPDWTKLDSPKIRDSKIPAAILIGSEAESPVKPPPKESGLRNEVGLDDGAIHMDNGLYLQAEPPDDEGIYVNFPFQELVQQVPEPTGEPKVEYQEDNAIEPPVVQTGPRTKTSTAQKRRTLNPKNLFSVSSRFFSSSTTSANQETVPVVNPMEAAQPEPIVSPRQSQHTTRPSSRSQPILVGYGPEPPLPKTPSIRLAQSPSSNRHLSPISPLMHRPSIGGLRSTSNKLIVPHPPDVPSHEMKHMTSQSLALLRAQEQQLIRRSTMLLAEAHVRATEEEVQFLNGTGAGNEIGIAMPLNNNNSINGDVTRQSPVTITTEHIDPFTGIRSIMPLSDASGPTSRKQSFVPGHGRGLSTGGFVQLGLGGKGPTQELQPGSVSMVELTQLATKPPAELPAKTKKKRKHWWKVWRLV